jgi:hypothetical protein
MLTRLRSLIRHTLSVVLYGAAGVFLTLVVVFVLYLNGRADLSVWHVAELDEEFTVDSGVSSFKDYLELEDRLFRQLDDEVYAEITPDQMGQINRYHKGSYCTACPTRPTACTTWVSACTAPAPTWSACASRGMGRRLRA